MPTPDGITDKDWDKVHTLALAIVKANLSSETSRHKVLKAKLFKLLRKLQAKYGALPSILATYADYTENDKSREALLLRAYSLSRKRKDDINQAEIAHSLTDLYVEKQKIRKAERWLMKLAVHVRSSTNKFLKQEIRRLRAELGKFRRKTSSEAAH